jgi:hypothetical protein
MKSIAGAILILAAVTVGSSATDGGAIVLVWPLFLLGAGYIVADWIGHFRKKS